MKIYTRTGDDGTTGLFGGGRVRKDCLRVAAYGGVDELNAALGLARALGTDPQLEELLARIQNDLFEVGADLATPEGVAAAAQVRRVAEPDASYLENAIDRLEETLQPLRQFILPGGRPLAAQLHFARSVCRRAERDVVALAAAERVGKGVLVFLNRLSDLLFVMAREANRRAGTADAPWKPRQK